MKLFGGIDPGQMGGISVLKENGEPFDIPFSFCEKTLDDIAEEFIQLSKFDIFCTIENVHSMPRQGVASSFKFGMNTGILHGMLAALKIKSMPASPQKWQKEMGCLTRGDKNVSKAMAQRLWPKLKITHSIADSLLIAEYCRRMNK